MRIVIDTNILVSALLNPGSAPDSVLQTSLGERKKQLLLSPDLLAEYEDVLNRKKFSKVFDKNDVSLFLTTLALDSIFIVPSTVVTTCEDADDNMLLALAIDGFADCIVSGDNHLLKLHPFEQIPILNAADFMNWLSKKAT